MSEPAVRLAGVASAAQTLAPVEGVDDFIAAQPLAEVAAVVELVVAPSLVGTVAPGPSASRTRLASGRVCGRPGEIGTRAKWGPVVWRHLIAADAEAVRGQIDALFVGARGGLYGFLLRPDGAGSAVTVPVRPMGPAVVTYAGGTGTRAVFNVELGEVEELIQ